LRPVIHELGGDLPLKTVKRRVLKVVTTTSSGVISSFRNGKVYIHCEPLCPPYTSEQGSGSQRQSLGPADSTKGKEYKMAIPAFSAEASLYKSNQSYQAVGSRRNNTGAPQAIMQLPPRPPGGGGVGGGGGLGAWGCWSSWCCGCSYHMDQYGNWNCCDYPCTRCIWPY
jgi:hypothetical protein